MTQIVGLYYNYENGVVIATDSRATYGERYSSTQKIFNVNNKLILASSGARWFSGKLVDNMENKINNLEDISAMINCIEDETAELLCRYSSPKRTVKVSPMETMVALICGLDNGKPVLYKTAHGCSDRIRHGYEIIGYDFVEPILKELYDERLSKRNAIELAVYAVTQTAEVVNTVDNNPQIAVVENGTLKILNIDKKERFNFVTKEIAKIKRRVGKFSEERKKISRRLLNKFLLE